MQLAVLHILSVTDSSQSNMAVMRPRAPRGYIGNSTGKCLCLLQYRSTGAALRRTGVNVSCWPIYQSPQYSMRCTATPPVYVWPAVFVLGLSYTDTTKLTLLTPNLPASNPYPTQPSIHTATHRCVVLFLDAIIGHYQTSLISRYWGRGARSCRGRWRRPLVDGPRIDPGTPPGGSNGRRSMLPLNAETGSRSMGGERLGQYYTGGTVHQI